MNGQETKQVLSVEVRHSNIRNDHIKILLLKQLHRSVCVISSGHKVTLLFQRMLEKQACDRIIFNNKDTAGSGRRLFVCLGLRRQR